MLVIAAGCSRDDEMPDLVQYRSVSGPDEFSVVVHPPVVKPTERTATLPQPTPGAPDPRLVDPGNRAVALLGGIPQDKVNPGIAVEHAPLMTHIATLGMEPGIRETLASEDLAFRQGKGARLVERMFSYSTYFRAYRPMFLDPVTESRRLSSAGINSTRIPGSGAR